MANEEISGRSESGIPYPSQFKPREPWAMTAAVIEETRIKGDVEKMTFAQVIDQRSSHLDSIELAKDRDTLQVKAYDLDRFDAGVRASKHGDAFDSYVKHEDQSLADRLNVSAAEAQAYRVQATDPNYSADPERVAAFHENRREVYRDAMAEMSEQLDERQQDARALYAEEQRQRTLDPDSAAALDAKNARKTAEFAEMAAERGMTPEQYAEALANEDRLPDANASASVRRLNDLDRDGVADHLEADRYDGEAERLDAAYQLQAEDRAYHMQRADHDEGRWIVQERDEAKGVFVDVLQTASALEAHERMQQGAGRDSRVLDDELKDYAAEWKREHPQAAPEISFHARSSFERDLEAETRFELQAVVDARSMLQRTLDQATESVSVAVDQVRDATAEDAAVHRGYEAAALSYAAAKRDLEAFEAQPSTSSTVVMKFRELQDAEKAAEEARLAAAHARIDGVSGEQAKTIEAAHQVAQSRLDALAQREGIALPAPAERSGNEIESALSPEQIRRLMQKPAQQEAEAQPAAPARPQLGEAHNQVRDQSAFADAAARDKLVPEDVAAAYKREGDKYLDANDPKRVAFVDKGNRLQTVRTFDDQAVADMVKTADARGWSEIKVTGDDAFRRKAWIEATARGIEVKGYEPTEKDKLRAEQLGRQTGHANAIEENKAVQAYRQARDGTPAEKKAAAQEHPELTKAFALEQAARSFAKQRLRPDDVERFVDANRQMIEAKLARGEQIPEVRKREDKERTQDHGISR